MKIFNTLFSNLFCKHKWIECCSVKIENWKDSCTSYLQNKNCNKENGEVCDFYYKKCEKCGLVEKIKF